MGICSDRSRIRRSKGFDCAQQFESLMGALGLRCQNAASFRSAMED